MAKVSMLLLRGSKKGVTRPFKSPEIFGSGIYSKEGGPLTDK